MKQVKAAKSAGAAWVLTLHDAPDTTSVGPRTWSPDRAAGVGPSAARHRVVALLSSLQTNNG